MYYALSTALLFIVGWLAITTPLWLIVYRFSYMRIVSRRLLDEASLPDANRVEPEHGHEECEFTTRDGLTLRGSYLRTSAPARLGVVLFCHELTGDRWNGLPYLSDLREQGWDVFTFDFRSHGRSEVQPGYDPKPWLTEFDRLDAHAALDYLVSRPDVEPRRIVVYGVSRGGGAALILAADRPREIGAVVTDGAYPVSGALARLVRRFMAGYTKLAWYLKLFPDWAFDIHILWAMSVRSRQTGVRYVRPESFAPRVRQPVLMIHGARDIYVTAELAKRLAGAVAGPTTFWSVPTAKHNGAIHTAPEEYHERLSSFVRPLAAPVKAARPTTV
ncbi:MAG TPA: alpha/beta fold hydrolase [Pirellulales bacterium]